ncbi:MAG: RNA polymerase factor sigma-54 [Pyrinomonadaceae bacterium]
MLARVPRGELTRISADSMAFLKLSQKLQQKMVLTPQLRQRIEMLQMTSLELSELIQQEVVANPVLEEIDPNDDSREIEESILDQNADGTEREYEMGTEDQGEFVENGNNDFDNNSAAKTNDEYATGEDERDFDDAREGDADAFDEIDLGREFQDYLDPGYKTVEFEVRDDLPTFEQFLSSSTTLADHLEWQLGLLDISDDMHDIGVSIIGNLDEYGRLNASEEELEEFCGAFPSKIEQVRQMIMRLEPVGCAVRGIRECLLVQLDVRGEKDSLAFQLVRDHLEDVQPHRLQKLAKATGVDLETLDKEIDKIRDLNPYPGKEYSTEKPIYVSPEVYIEKVEDDYVIYFSDYGAPQLRISRTYQEMLSQKDTTRETKSFIKDNVRSAVDLLRNIEHRRQTIYKVVECIVHRQRDFLDYGVRYIKPMMLKDVAEDIGMHLSTVSRVVNRKYAHTPQGVIELRRFFSEGMLNEDGEEVSTRILKLKIKKMIEDEDTRKPLTDDKIAKVLGKDRVKISRRTVAKYRDQMNIPGSRERRTVI